MGTQTQENREHKEKRDHKSLSFALDNVKAKIQDERERESGRERV
jgi:hypothetical protein